LKFVVLTAVCVSVCDKAMRQWWDMKMTHFDTVLFFKVSCDNQITDMTLHGDYMVLLLVRLRVDCLTGLA